MSLRVEVRVGAGGPAALGGGAVRQRGGAAGGLLPRAGRPRALPPALPDHTRGR